MSPVSERLADYLRIRRQLGFELEHAAHALEDFVAFLDRSGAERLTTDLAVRWACQPVDVSPRYLSLRLGMVRGFARYLATIDPDTEIPSKDLLPGPVTRITPYLYCDREIRELMAAAERADPGAARCELSDRDRFAGGERDPDR
jgi:integrase/recombinase XerD